MKPEDIRHMYIAPSGYAKFAQAYQAVTDVNRMIDGELSSDRLEEGYMYMESANVQVKKKKTQYCMVQVLNPTFSKDIKVYNDPWAKSTAGIGVAGITVAGDLDKSYYIKKKGEDVARKITKKDYRKEREELFAECPEVLSKYENSIWADFEAFIFDYATTCK